MSPDFQFLFDGNNLVADYNGSGVMQDRYVPGPATDEPVVWYQGSGTTTRLWLHADVHGSEIGYSDSSGNSDAIYGYGPFGEPNVWSGSRYRYTGQLMIPEAQLYYYKARVYDPSLGRFLQTDPIGYASDINAYAYARNDAINGRDPSGLESPSGTVDEVVVTAAQILPEIMISVYITDTSSFIPIKLDVNITPPKISQPTTSGPTTSPGVEVAGILSPREILLRLLLNAVINVLGPQDPRDPPSPPDNPPVERPVNPPPKTDEPKDPPRRVPYPTNPTNPTPFGLPAAVWRALA